MSRPTLVSSWSSTQKIVGGLGDGYFALHNGADANTATETISLYHVSDPSTAVDTVGSLNLYRIQVNQNQSGSCWYLWHDTTAATVETVHVTQSGGVLTVTAVGGFSGSFAGNARQSWVAPDASEIMWHDFGAGIIRIISTSTGANTYSYGLAAAGHTGQAIAALGSAKALVHCTTHGAWELFDCNAGTLLDSLTFTSTYDAISRPYPYRIAGTDTVFAALGLDATEPTYTYDVGVLSTAGDVVSWSVGPDAYYPGWGNTINAAALLATWTGVRLMVPRTSVGLAANTMVSLSAANAASPSAVESVLQPGVYDYQFATVDATHIIAGLTYPNASGAQQTWSLWSLPTGPTYLRQRQSPVRAPSRVSPVNLRNRQTSMIR